MLYRKEGAAMANERRGTPMQIYLPAELKEAMAALAERNHRKLTGEVVLALENHLAANGVAYNGAVTAPTAKKKSNKK